MQNNKFRFWDPLNKKMYNASPKSDLFIKSDGSIHCQLDSGENSGLVEVTGRMFPMRFTDFADMSGKDIIEGDILMYTKIVNLPGKGKKTRTDKHYWEVYMSPKGQWVAKRGEVITALHTLCVNHEVVGNVLENKDLLQS